MKIFATILFLSTLAVASGCQSNEPVETVEPASLGLPSGAVAAAEAINEATLKPHIAILSDDLMMGRAPASDGDRIARKYLADQLEALGYSPGVQDESWEQRFDIVSIVSSEPPEWRFEMEG
ncbi:MAG TPA: hypothetical protein VMO47_15060, partial [Rhodothermales bacterium]|nr:hypothetical protein [Rhodothermales bacterium]